jgi:hypothetical protein
MQSALEPVGKFIHLVAFESFGVYLHDNSGNAGADHRCCVITLSRHAKPFSNQLSKTPIRILSQCSHRVRRSHWPSRHDLEGEQHHLVVSGFVSSPRRGCHRLRERFVR